MKRNDLNQLRDLPTPPPSEGARERALHRAVLAFRTRPKEVSDKASPAGMILQAVGLSLAVFLVMVWLLPSDRSEDFAVQRRVLQEMGRVFPESLNAVIESPAGTEVDLASAGSENQDQPLLIEFSKKGRTVRVLSYSGRDVTLSIDGARVSVEGLITADGHVIVAGSDFLWTPDRQARWEGYQIRACAL
ncbi:MAG: hypothetical protein BGO12_15770 [Verrucomicrobia bacterium 61-8]|nr:hypothetical protein [Verrucomicrobiota bacterium]OJV15693.1 MAG: hypothetical protein BGO12_15770 [Verrucomicrobia bacterium 61-8]